MSTISVEEKIARAVSRRVYGVDRDDATQEARLAIHRARTAHDPARASWETHAWMAGTYAVRSFLRQQARKRLTSVDDEVVAAVVDGNPNPEQVASANERCRWLRQHLDETPDAARLLTERSETGWDYTRRVGLLARLRREAERAGMRRRVA